MRLARRMQYSFFGREFPEPAAAFPLIYLYSEVPHQIRMISRETGFLSLYKCRSWGKHDVAILVRGTGDTRMPMVP